MIQLTHDVLKERITEKCREVGTPASLTVVLDGRTITFAHQGCHATVNDVPEFADPADLDCVLECALISLCHDLAEKAAEATRDIPFAIRLLAHLPHGQPLALRWCRRRALLMSRELMK